MLSPSACSNVGLILDLGGLTWTEAVEFYEAALPMGDALSIVERDLPEEDEGEREARWDLAGSGVETGHHQHHFGNRDLPGPLRPFTVDFRHLGGAMARVPVRLGFPVAYVRANWGPPKPE